MIVKNGQVVRIGIENLDPDAITDVAITWLADYSGDLTPRVFIQFPWASPTKLANPATLPTGTGWSAAWSPNGEFLAIAHDFPPYVTIYQRSGTTFTKLADPAILPVEYGNSAAWSPNGEFLAIAHDFPPYVTIYQTSSTMPAEGIARVKGVIREGD